MESQATQLGIQAAQECERLAKDRSMALQLLQKVQELKMTSYISFGCSFSFNTFLKICVFQEKERLANLERRYQSLSGGKTFPKSSNTIKEVSRTVIECFMSL